MEPFLPQRCSGKYPLMAEINVTSLVDVAFTLLVIFMITAPMLQGGVEVQVPEAEVSPLTSQDQPIIISIDEQGRVFLGRTEIAQDEVAHSLPLLLRATNQEMVYIQGDHRAQYGPVMNIIATVYRVPGIRIGFVAQPTPREPGGG